MTVTLQQPLRQRADLTHKYNLGAGRHGWLRLTPAYSVRIVEEIMDRTTGHLRVLDPFCGTATTALSAAYHGHSAVTTEINPFLVWLAKAKTATYTPRTIATTRHASEKILSLVHREALDPFTAPPIHNIERWWSKDALRFLCHLHAAINDVTRADSPSHNLLNIAFCRTLIKLSNAAFNHQSMSFKPANYVNPDSDIPYADAFRTDLHFVLAGAEENPPGIAAVLQHDARSLSSLPEKKFNLVITSPPYANRMSYIRELRPYMYWLGFLTNGRDAGELDWSSIGGTWGIATSRLAEWKPPTRGSLPSHLLHTLRQIAAPSNPNGQLLATYVHKYFADMAEHLSQLPAVLAPKARIHYIIGNSTFYGVLLPTERYYADLLKRNGFTDISVRPVRKRNSKKELVEFDISALWKG